MGTSIENLLEIIPESEADLRQVITETENPKGTLMDSIGWPTDQWH